MSSEKGQQKCCCVLIDYLFASAVKNFDFVRIFFFGKKWRQKINKNIRLSGTYLAFKIPIHYLNTANQIGQQINEEKKSCDSEEINLKKCANFRILSETIANLLLK